MAFATIGFAQTPHSSLWLALALTRHDNWWRVIHLHFSKGARMKSYLAATLVLSSAFLVACGEEAPPPAKAPSPAVTNAVDAAKKAADDAKDAAVKASDAAKDATEASKDAAVNAAEASKEAAASATEAAKAANAEAAATLTDAEKQAQTWIDQVMTDIRAKKFDSAEAGLKKLEEIKASLPESLQGKINSLRDALTAGKTADSLKVPDGVMK